MPIRIIFFFHVDIHFRINHAYKIEVDIDEDQSKGFQRKYVYKLSQGAIESIASHLNRRVYSQNSLKQGTESSQNHNHFKLIFSQSVGL